MLRALFENFASLQKEEKQTDLCPRELENMKLFFAEWGRCANNVEPYQCGAVTRTVWDPLPFRSLNFGLLSFSLTQSQALRIG